MRLAGQPATQVHAAIAAAVQAGVPVTIKRKAEARLKLHDSNAAQEVIDCADATPFRMAAYQAALACATDYGLCEHCLAEICFDCCGGAIGTTLEPVDGLQYCSGGGVLQSKSNMSARVKGRQHCVRLLDSLEKAQ